MDFSSAQKNSQNCCQQTRFLGSKYKENAFAARVLPHIPLGELPQTPLGELPHIPLGELTVLPRPFSWI